MNEDDELPRDDQSEDDFFADDVGADDEPTVLPQPATQAASKRGGSLFFETPPPTVDVKAMFPDSDPATSTPRVVNTLSYLRIGRPVDLRVLTCGARNVEYDPRRHAAVMRLREPPCAALLRATGTVSIAGATSVAAAKRAGVLISRIVRTVMGWNDELKQVQFALKSIMVRFDLRHPIRIEDFARARPDICAYEPETFCGCTVKLRGICADGEWLAASNIFVSGKVTMTGLRSLDAMWCAYNALLPILAPFARGAIPSRA